MSDICISNCNRFDLPARLNGSVSCCCCFLLSLWYIGASLLFFLFLLLFHYSHEAQVQPLTTNTIKSISLLSATLDLFATTQWRKFFSRTDAWLATNSCEDERGGQPGRAKGVLANALSVSFLAVAVVAVAQSPTVSI